MKVRLVSPSLCMGLALSAALYAAPCAAQIRERKEAVESAPAVLAPSFPKLLAALLLAGQDPETSAYLGRTRPSKEPPSEDDVWMFEQAAAVFQERFRGGLVVKSLAEAKASGADVIAILEIRSKVPKTIFTKAAFELRAALLDPVLKPIDTLEAEGSQSPRPPLTPSDLKRKASEKALASLREAFGKSTKLAEAARSLEARGSSPAPAPAAAAAPAPKSDVDSPSYRSKEDPDAFALVIGIEKYSEVPEARFAERDAAAMREHLRAMGVPDRNIVFLAGPAASKAGLAKNLETWLPRNVNERSTVFFYYSGHGAPDTRTGQSYLVPWDGDPRFLDDTAYPVKRLYEKLGALKVRRVVAALDACFSGAGGRSVLPKGARPLVLKTDAGTEAPDGLTVFSAAAADEISGADENQGHGLFTYHFLKGLAGEAAGGDGRVSAQGLYEYLSPRVRDAARRENRDQSPALHGPKSGEPVYLR